jgi:hypothetical protein
LGVGKNRALPGFGMDFSTPRTSPVGLWTNFQSEYWTNFQSEYVGAFSNAAFADEEFAVWIGASSVRL